MHMADSENCLDNANSKEVEMERFTNRHVDCETHDKSTKGFTA